MDTHNKDNMEGHWEDRQVQVSWKTRPQEASTAPNTLPQVFSFCSFEEINFGCSSH